MKKKILSLVLAMTLVLAYAVPVAAAETDAQTTEAPAAEAVVAGETFTPAAVEDAEAAVPNTADAEDKVSEDAAVQAAYDAYKAMEKALADGDFAALKDAAKYLETLEFETDAQQDEYDALIEEKVGVDNYLNTAFSAAYVIDANDKYEAYKADKNAATAYDFVAAVDTVTVDCELNMETFVPGISADYEDAKANYLPDEDVVKVYEAYADVAYVMELGYYDSDFSAACEAFEATLDIFNELTDAQLADLAVLLGVSDGEEAWSLIFGDWINANLILQIGEAQAAWTADQNKETATAFVEVYESVLNDTQVLTDADKELILVNFGFDYEYEAAKAYLEELADEQGTSEEGTAESTTEGSDKSDKDTSPETGDDFNAAPFAALMVIAAAVALLAVRRENVQ